LTERYESPAAFVEEGDEDEDADETAEEEGEEHESGRACVEAVDPLEYEVVSEEECESAMVDRDNILWTYSTRRRSVLSQQSAIVSECTRDG
jgi:hypothetical protein